MLNRKARDYKTRRLEIARLRNVTRAYRTCAFAGATATPTGRFTPIFEKGRLKRASQDSLDFPDVPGSPGLKNTLAVQAQIRHPRGAECEA